jgi:hypothetical protein
MSVWLTDLADILRSAGVNVIEERYTQGPYAGKNWKQVGWQGRPLTAFRYIMWHHDASPVGDSPGALHWVKYSTLAPAGAIWVCSGCNGAHPSGTWHLYAAGLSNHAGTGGPWTPNNGAPPVPINGMNSVSLGIETDHTFGESWEGAKKQAQLNSIRMGTAAILAAYNLPSNRVIRHLDWTNGMIDGNPRFATFGRKNDIDGLNLPYERRLLDHVIKQLQRPDVQDKQLARLERMRRTWRRKRDEIRESGKTAGLATARKKIRELNQRIRKIGG